MIGNMATAKTGSFYLTETVTLPNGSASGTRVQGTIDLGAYVNVATGQAVAIESVDFIVQIGTDYNAAANTIFPASDGALGYQLTDLNPGSAFVRADNQSLIASGVLNVDATNNVVTHVTDLFPDNFGPASLSEAFMVVNDSLYFVAGNDTGVLGGSDVFVTARIKCRVAKLSSKDWMAIAIQSTASDN